MPSTDRYSNYSSLSPISRNILVVLLNEREPITSSVLGNRLGISARSVQYHIRKELTHLSKELELNLQNKPNYGVYISNSCEEKRKLLAKLEQAQPMVDALTVQQRKDILTLHILFDEEHIDIDTLAKRFNRSRGTLLKDVASLKEDLQKQGILLSWNKSKGYFIKGNERMIREVILRTIFNNYTMIELLNICKGKTQIKNVSHPLNFLPNSQIFYLSQYPLRYYWDMIVYIAREFDVSLDEPLHVELALYLSLIIHRNLKRYNIDKKFHPNLSSSGKEFTIANRIIKKLEKKHQIKLGYSEAAYLSLKLTLIIPNTLHDHNEPHISPSDQIQGIASSIIHYASQYLHPCLKTDQELYIGLCNHLEICTNRIRNHQLIKNQYLPEILRKYQYIYQIAKLCTEMVEKHVHLVFPDDEVGYLTMHFVAAIERLHLLSNQEINTSVVCGEDSSVLIMLLSRLNAEYPNINVRSIFNPTDITPDKVTRKMYDLVISTTPLNYLDASVVVISPFVNQNDKNRILEVISKVNQKNLTGYEEINLSKLPSLSTLLTKKNILMDVRVKSWQEAVNTTCAILEKENSIERRYARTILKGLSENGPYMVSFPNIALFHAKPSDGVRKLSIGLAHFNMPVSFGHQDNDPVRLAFVIATTNRTSHLRILYELSNICADKDIASKLKHTNSKQELLDLINSQCKLYQQLNYP